MTVDDIIRAVRYSIDEEAVNAASLADASTIDGLAIDDTALMNNIIRNKIGDALRWICLYAPADLLGGTDSYTINEQDEEVPVLTGILVDKSEIPESIGTTTGGKLTMPADFVKLARIRVTGWHRAVKELLSEDSDEYLQLRDDNGATATADRPQAALIEKSVREIEVWPKGTKAEYTYVANLNTDEVIKTKQEGGQNIEYVAIPPRVKTSFIYYLAFLLLSAYGDSRSERMLSIAQQNLNVNAKQ